jgi:hypothetical protein
MGINLIDNCQSKNVTVFTCVHRIALSSKNTVFHTWAEIRWPIKVRKTTQNVSEIITGWNSWFIGAPIFDNIVDEWSPCEENILDCWPESTLRGFSEMIDGINPRGRAVEIAGCSNEYNSSEIDQP